MPRRLPPQMIPGPAQHDLTEMLKHVERDVERPEPGTAFVLLRRGDGSVLLRGRSFRHYSGAVSKLSRSAIAHGGPIPEVVQRMIQAFVWLALDEDEPAALAALEEALGAPAGEWTFVEPFDAEFRNVPSQVGACSVLTDLASIGADPLSFGPRPSTPRYLSVTVFARGKESARRVAIERVAEATALLGRR